jgi:hypothetical protein
MWFPGRRCRFEAGQLCNDVQETCLAMQTRPRGDMLPLKEKPHEFGRSHWLDFFSQPADGQAMNARQ